MPDTDRPGKNSSTAYRQLFRNRHFMALWVGQTISFIGDYFNWLAIPIMVERLTGSTLMVGLSVIASALPALLFGPVAGVLVDRWDRKRTMIAADLIRALLVLICLTVRTADQVWVYYVVGFLMACVSQLFFPAQNAVLPLIVRDKDDLLSANGLMQIVQTAGLLVGPAMAGYVIGLWGEQMAFWVDSATFVLSALAVMTMTVPHAAREEETARQSRVADILAEFWEGVTYLFESRTMVGVLLCRSVVMLGLGAINVLWVPYLQRVFGVGAEGIGLVDSAQGAGMALSGLLLGFLTARFSVRYLISYGLLLIGLLLTGMGLASSFTQIMFLSVGIGLALVPPQSGLVTIMQLAVPDAKRGRVSGAFNAVSTAAGLLSMAAAAGFSELVGLRAVYVIAGALVAVSGLLGFKVLQEPVTVSDSLHSR